MLRNQLVQVEPGSIDDLHERAAYWYEKNGFIQKSIDHAFQSSNGNVASRLIEKHALSLLYQGEVSRVMDWFGKLPKKVVKSSPVLCTSKAWSLALMLRRMHIEEVVQLLQDAEDALTLTKADQESRNWIRGNIASIQAYIWLPTGKPGWVFYI